MSRVMHPIYETNVKTTISRVEGIELPNNRRTIILNMYEAKRMLDAGKTVFEKTVERDGRLSHFYYIEVDFNSLIEIAQ